MEKKFCHLIVGFSIADYFKNLLWSTLDLDNESDIIVVTTGNPLLFGWGGVVDYEFNESKKIENLVNHYKKKYKRENIYYYNLEVSKKKKEDPKCGALYSAYNLALEKAFSKGIHYLNIMQNDSQMMLWSNNIKKITESIFESQKDTFFLCTGFFRKMLSYNLKNIKSRKVDLSVLGYKKDLLFHETGAVGDWGIFDLKKLKKINFTFEQNENYLTQHYAQKGYKLFYSPIPFVSLIPWPVTVRQKRIIGSVLKCKDEKYLVMADGVDENKLLSNYISFKEDCVKTNKWWALEPNWVTDLNLSYLKSIFRYYKENNKVSGFFFSNKNKKRFFYPPSAIEPYRPELFKFILFSPFSILLKIINKILIKIK